MMIALVFFKTFFISIFCACRAHLCVFYVPNTVGLTTSIIWEQDKPEPPEEGRLPDAKKGISLYLL